MYRKLLSTIIAALVVFGAVAVMPAMAAVDEVGTVYYRDDFENYTLNTEYNSVEKLSNTNVTDKDGNHRWYTDEHIGAKIVSVEGYDGQMTQALKIYILDNSTNYNDGNRRIYLNNPAGYEAPTSGIAVSEFKIKNDSIKQFGGLFRKESGSSSINYSTKENSIGYHDANWTKIKVVHDIETGNTISYVNDVMTTYHKYTGDTGIFMTRFANIVGDSFQYKVTEGFVPGQDYMLVDDFNFYYAPAATAVSETFPANGAEGAKFATEPSVTFTHPLMNVITDVSVGEGVTAPTTVVTTDNAEVEVIECADESKLGEVEIEEVTLSNGNKTLNIVPAEDFPSNAKIQVTVSGLKDDMGRDIAEVVYTFTTMEVITLTGTPVFKKENLVFSEGTTITSLENGYISCKYELTNESATSDVNVLYYAVLKVNDVVTSFQFKPATIAKGGKATFNGGFTVKDAENSVIEVYVWDGFQNMTSLVPSVVFE